MHVITQWRSRQPSLFCKEAEYETTVLHLPEDVDGVAISLPHVYLLSILLCLTIFTYFKFLVDKN